MLPTLESRGAMQELKRSHAEQDAEVRRLSKEMQQMKRRARERGGPMKIREPQRSIARVLVCLNNGEPTAAVEYVARSNKTSCWDGVRKGKLEADLRDWWKAADVETRQRHVVVDESNRKAIVQAKRFVVDGTLEEWVDSQNVQKGINPVPAIVLQEAIAVKRRMGVEPPANRKSSRRWLQRWRSRRGIKLRRGNVREHLTRDQMHGKVTHGAAQKTTGGWTGFGFPGRRVEKNGDHFPGPKSRPRSRVVIKTVPGKWSPFFRRCGPRTQKMGSNFGKAGTPDLVFRAPWMGWVGAPDLFSGDRLVEVEQLPPAHGST